MNFILRTLSGALAAYNELIKFTQKVLEIYFYLHREPPGPPATPRWAPAGNPSSEIRQQPRRGTKSSQNHSLIEINDKSLPVAVAFFTSIQFHCSLIHVPLLKICVKLRFGNTNSSYYIFHTYKIQFTSPLIFFPPKY